MVRRRFCGPPDSGNGGYVAGLLAGRLAAAAVEVTLRRPPPLEQKLAVVPVEDPGGSGLALQDEDGPIAFARPAPFDLETPAPPSWEEAERASAAYHDHPHPFPTCFVCGPGRGAGDGLRIFPGPLGGDFAVVASPWIPDASLADGDGTVRPEFLWAALDCPGGLAIMAREREPFLLGRMTARIERNVPVGERCVAVGFQRGQEGRKCFAGTALFDGAGRLCGRASQVWIAPR